MIHNRARMQPGREVAGRFVIEALAGQGGMGAVYRARDRSTNRTVALKIIAGDDGSGGRFEQEARLLAELEHPAIVRYIAHGKADDAQRFLAMEWLDGEDLGAALLRGVLSIDDAQAVARRVAEALVAAHTRGIVHRDIKPANLFLPNGDVTRLKVLDFGIARSHAARPFDSTVLPITKTGGVIGTVGYMSPEQARGSSTVDARTDVFALGCVLFECVTGRPAFAGANAVAVLAKVLLEEAPRTRHFEPMVPPDLDELIARMLAKAPSDRPRDATAVLRALEVSRSSGSSSSSGGVGDREHRMVTILLVRGIETTLEDAIVLADGARLVELRGNDPTTAAAARALAIMREHPLASIAIATGPVSHSEGTAYGPIIDRVATIASAAPGIAIDEVSERLLGDRFEIVDGKLVGQAHAATAPRTLLGRQTPCVGRDKELALLQATFRECVDEPIARAAVVTGVAGAGKSRLAHELLSQVRDEATVLIARGDPVGAGGSLAIARQLVRCAAGLRDADDPSAEHEALRAHLDRFFSGDQLARTAETLGELVGAPSPSPSPELRAVRDDARILGSWLSRSFGDWIAALSEAGPVLCVVEDLHWGDGGSVAYLDEALRRNATAPLMVLALARPEVLDLFPSLWARAGVQEIRLGPLTKRAAERLVRSVLVAPSEELVGRLVERAEGNAFHLEELIRQAAEGSTESLPATLLALASARIGRLEPEARRFLRVASIFGETFREPAIRALLAREDTSVDLVRELVDRETIVASPAGHFDREFRFRHGLLRDAAYAMLANEDRTLLHARAGEWLEANGEQEPLVLAEHFERGRDLLRAAPFFLRAAERACEAWNATLGAALVERVLRCNPAGETLGSAHLLNASSALARGLHVDTVRHAKAALALLPAGSEHHYMAAAFVLRSGVFIGDIELAPSIIHELLTTTPEGRLTSAYGEAVSFAIDMLDGVGQLEACEQLLSKVEARIDDADAACQAYVTYGRAAASLRRDADLGGIFETLERGAIAMAELGVSRVTDLFRFGRALLHIEVGDCGTARRLLEENVRIMGDAPLLLAWCAIHVGWCYFVEGRFAEAIIEARKAYALDPHHAYTLGAIAHLALGERTEAERLSARSLQGIRDGLVTPFVVALAHAAAAEIALTNGRLDEAARLIDHACSVTHASPGSNRSFVERRKLAIMLARGEDTSEVLARSVARIERHSRSLSLARRASYRALPDHQYILELAQP